MQIESSHTLSLDRFVDKADIDQIYLDTPYYLAPGDKVSEEAFAVIREAMEKKKMAGLARIVLYRRERPCVIEPHGKGMLLTTLRYDNTVRKEDVVFDDIKDADTEKEMLDLATHIVTKKSAKFDPSRFDDQYETALMELVESKRKGRKAPKPKAEAAEPSNVVNLFDALKKSLASGDEGGKDDKAKGKKGGKSTSKRKSA